LKYKDYYAALEVPRDADAETIKKAYRKLARKFHPDVSKEPQAEARFKEIGEAYETLKEPDKRAEYDSLGRRREGEEFAAPPDWASQFNAGSGASFEDLDLSDLLDALSRGRRPRDDTPRRGRDPDLTAEISLEDAHGGTTLALGLQGAAGEQSLEITVPPGVVPGQKLRLRGRGSPGSNGGPAGDIYVHIALQPHARYRVHGRDLYFDLPLAPWEAVLGAEVHVATLAGEVQLKIPPGTHSGRKLRMRGRGLGKADAAGDLYAVVTIDVPAHLTERERELFEALAAESRFDPRAGRPTETPR
jgi:curved DNA-binding protein